MNDENRQILVKQQIDKAETFLSQADEMCSLQHWDLAANRYYYSCFHIVQGLFIAKSISAHTHAGVVTQFSMHFVKAGLIDVQYGSFLARLMQLRQKADYNCVFDITESEVQDIAPLAHRFIEAVKSML